MVPRGAQEPGLLWLHQATHTHHHHPCMSCLVNFSLPRWILLFFIFLEVMFTAVFPLCACCSYPQVRRAWTRCCPGHWEQKSPSPGAGSFPEHSLQPGCLPGQALNASLPKPPSLLVSSYRYNDTVSHSLCWHCLCIATIMKHQSWQVRLDIGAVIRF